MGKPYRSGSTPDNKPLWSARARTMGEDVFVSGHESAKSAREELERKVRALKEQGRPMHGGPKAHSVAQALQRYAMERLAYMKGAPALARDINRYLRAGYLDTLEVLELPASEGDVATQEREKAMHYPASVCIGDRYVVKLQSAHTPRVIPKGLSETCKKRITKTATSSRHREVLATTPMADVTRHQIQSMFDAMRSEGSAAATVLKERSLLSPLFKYAKRHWRWSDPAENPVTGLKLPRLDNARKRVMSAEEERLLAQAMAETRNVLVEPTSRLLAQTAMRVGEAIYQATWADVDWEGMLLNLTDSKTGEREVPLSPGALQALRDLQALVPADPSARIVGISYEALKAAWRRACERAGIKDLRLHDLRHTAATRMALKTGNVFLVKALTGHKTLAMVERYVNVKAKDVVAVLHGQQPASLYAGMAKPSPGLSTASPEGPTEGQSTPERPLVDGAGAQPSAPATSHVDVNPVVPNPAFSNGSAAARPHGLEDLSPAALDALMAAAMRAVSMQQHSKSQSPVDSPGRDAKHDAGPDAVQASHAHGESSPEVRGEQTGLGCADRREVAEAAGIRGVGDVPSGGGDACSEVHTAASSNVIAFRRKRA